MVGAPMIRVRSMHKAYRTGRIVNEVLHDVDLEIDDGEMVTIIGPSGSGKTTLLLAIGGLDRDYRGTIEVDGKDLHKLDDVSLSDYRNRSIGFVFQSFNLLEHMTCRENVALPALFARGKDAVEPKKALARAAEVLERVGLAEKVDAPPNTLSGGQKQRVAIARALFNQPRMLLCDEPTGNLDSAIGGQIIDLFAELNREEGITVLIVTHDPRISEATPRTIRVEDGKIYDDGRGNGTKHAKDEPDDEPKDEPKDEPEKEPKDEPDDDDEKEAAS